MDIVVSIVSGSVGAATVVWLARAWLIERLQKSIAHEYDTRLERLRSDLRADVELRLVEAGGELTERFRLVREKWELKHQACLKALDVIDRSMTQANFPEAQLRPEWRDVTIDEIRDVYNRLALSLDRMDVLDLYCTLLGIRKENQPAAVLDQALVQDFRNAIRRELGFGMDLALDRAHAWIGVRLVNAPPQAHRR